MTSAAWAAALVATLVLAKDPVQLQLPLEPRQGFVQPLPPLSKQNAALQKQAPLPPPLPPPPPSGRPEGGTPTVSKVIAFGAINSRGAYEAGVAYGILHHLRRKHGHLAGVAGSSVGTLNAFLSALAFCERDFAGPDQSPFWRIWQAVDWRSFFPGDRTCAEYQAVNPDIAVACSNGRPFRASDALFSSNVIDGLIERILRMMADPDKRACAVPLGIHLISDTPVELELGGYPISTSRRYLAVELTSAAGQATDVVDLPERPASDADKRTSVRGFERLFLPSTMPGQANQRRPLDRRVLLQALAAALAEPPLILTPPLSYCGQGCAASGEAGLYCPAHQTVCKDRFLEGGVFDRVPLAAARAISAYAAAPEGVGAAPPDFVVIDPSRADLKRRDDQRPRGLRGSGLYREVVKNFVSVGTDYELQTIQRYRPRADREAERLDGRGVRSVKRTADIAGALMLGTAALFDERFRRHDYYRGIYDGLAWAVEDLARQAGGAQELVERDPALQLYSNYADEFGNWLERPSSPQTPNPRALRASAGLTYVMLSTLSRALCSKGAARQQRAACHRVRANLERIACKEEELATDDGKPAPITCDPQVADLMRIERALHQAQLPGKQDVTDLFFDEGERFARALHQLGFEDGDAQYGATKFVTEHEHWRLTTVQQLVGRLGDIETAQGHAELGTALGLTEYVAAIAATRRKPELQLGSTTIPDRVRGRGILATVQKLALPYTAAVDVTNGGGRLVWELGAYRWPWSEAAPDPDQRKDATAGDEGQRKITPALDYRFPTLRAPTGRSSLRLTLGTTLHWFRHVEPGVAYGPTLGAELGLDNAAISDVGVRGWWHPFGHPWQWSDGTIDFYLRPLWGRMEAAFGWRPVPDCRTPDCRRQLYVTIGLADVNGLAYWLFRALIGNGS